MSDPDVQNPESPPARPAGRWVVSAPAQVNLIGDDGFCCDSYVLPVAIDLRVRMAADRRSDSLISVTRDDGATALLSPDGPPGTDAPLWAHLLHGVLAGYLSAPAVISGLDVRISSDIPENAGLGCSAALLACFATLLEGASGFSLGHAGKVQLCRQTAQACGVPCGAATHFCTVHARAGHAMLLDCRHQRADHIPLGNAALILLDTGRRGVQPVHRSLRREECEEAARVLGISSFRELTMGGLPLALPRLRPELAPRVRHLVTEITRAICAAESARHGDWNLAGQLISASHDSLGADFSATIPEVDYAAACARELPGVAGCRSAGDGFCVAVAEPEHAAAAAGAWAAAWSREFGTCPAVHVTLPSDGARLEKSGERQEHR